MAYGDFFEFDGKSLIVNEPEILLVKEFGDLWNDIERNKCKSDKTGEKRLLAKSEFSFIWLMYNYRTPYKDYISADKYDACINDSGLTKEQLKDLLLIKACKKYQELLIQRAHRLIQSANETCDNLVVFLRGIDPDERKVDGSLVHNHKNIMDSLTKIDGIVENLINTKKRIEKENMALEDKVRGDSKKGLFDK